MKNRPVRTSPSDVIAVGNYSHVTIVPRNAQLYTFSGQIGADESGNLPDDYNKQIENTFINIDKVLNSQSLNADDVIKVNIWATEEIDWENVFDPIWDKFFGNTYPSMTIAYVRALGLPEIKIEIEILAAKV
ncbi:MAG: RidA family protein [Macellibacteroides fermentans]|jgi:2-iminobutanoate/2-iminopropanoate deaminase|uniref:Enamine deaminase RidA, house cleaning of reactive enamine intermediates, YjgF/YER057c/UK114 family n=1 Tax=Parabacteroides chartae TaxID=1037355 RepID=A0A1T5A7U5_9BACT|nr:RidA family protein [Parabacteroides chartae]MBP8026720.1 RidA family protein [Parabacteroides sp.]SKB30985.1 Enamine deaminase RidA, house cleaning of reactive enamine intermediates, YjgF/YER057c/UK114 family [Parabacteroides chartae]HNP91108.1 RidA family protein [Macellibacteroides fermentans]